MAVKTFSDGEAIRFGWNTMKKNILFFIGILIVVFIASMAPDIIRVLAKGRSPIILTIIGIIFWILQIIIGMGLIKIGLKFCDNQKPAFATLFSCVPLFFKYLAGSIIYALIVLAGIILFVIPGIIWSIKFQYFPYLIIDKGMGPIEALKKSAVITNGAKWELLAFGFVLTVINILGIICLVIGLFAVIPATLIAYAFVYRKLSAQTDVAVQPTAV
jgi:uncharacterized membrane protein